MAGRPRPRPRLLVLGAGPAQLGLLEAARARGDLDVIAVDRDPQAVGFAHADERAVLSSEDEEGIDRLARARKVAGIVSPGADWPVGIAARIAERLGLAHPIDARTGALATSKARQREAFAAAGVPHARALDPRDPTLGFPCIVKAPDRQGQRGLALVTDRRELDTALEAALAESRFGSVLVEEHVEGPEVTVNAFSVDGRFTPLTVTDRLTADPPAFGVALAHAWPSVHEEEPIVAIAQAAVEALGIRDGPSYTQLRLGADGPVVMEVAARLGGGHDAELCRAAVGVDLNALAIEAALGSVHRGLSPAGGLSPVVPRGQTPPGSVPGRRGRLPRSAGGKAGRASRASRQARLSTASSGCGSTAGRATSSGRSFEAPTERGRCSPRAARARTHSSGLAVRRGPYASESMRTRRRTTLGFQPPAVGEEEIAAVAETLRSGWLTTGPRTALLEERLAAYLEVEHVLAVSSGTAAMHLALLALGVGPGDEVITSPITWPATANVIEHCGATPVFCDVREGDLNLDPALLPRGRDRADEGDPPRPPRGPAVRPRSDPRARPPGRRGRGPCARGALPRPQARRPLRRDLLLALRDEESRRRGGRARRDESRRRRGGDPPDAAHAPRRRRAATTR